MGITILDQALARYAAGETSAARTIIIAYVQAHPGEAAGWLALSRVLEDAAQKKDCYRRALAANSESVEAKTGLESLTSPAPDLLRPAPEATARPSPTQGVSRPSFLAEPQPAAPIPASNPEPRKPVRPPPAPARAAAIPSRPAAVARAAPVAAADAPVKKPSRAAGCLWWSLGGIAVASLAAAGIFFLTTLPTAVPAPTSSGSLQPPTETPLAVVSLPPRWTDTPTPTVSPTPSATFTPTVSPTPTFAPPDPTEAKVMDKVMQQVVDLRGLTPKRDLPMFMINRSTAENILQGLLAESGYADRIDAEKRKLVALGFIKATYDLREYALSRLADNVAGFYVPAEDTLYVIGGAMGGMEKIIFSHEYGHSLVFQNFPALVDRSADRLCLTDSQRCEALTALIEGDATLLEYQWIDQYATEKDWQDVQNYIVPGRGINTERHPPYAYYQSIFPYQQGANFVYSLYLNGNWARVNEAYDNPPVSTEQILHPEKYLAGEQPAPVAAADLQSVLGAEWTEETNDTLGEFLTFLLLAYGADYSAEISEKQAAGAAAGWGGDRYQIWHRPSDDASLLVAQWTWDTTSDNNAFLSAMKTYLNYRFRGANMKLEGRNCWEVNHQTTCLVGKGKNAAWILAPNLGLIDAILPQLTILA